MALRCRNSETGCIARASAFDQTIELAARNGIGYAVWELMISDCRDCADTRRWKHGLLYTDGTTRDPAAIAAVGSVSTTPPPSLLRQRPDCRQTQGAERPAQRQRSEGSLLVSFAIECDGSFAHSACEVPSGVQSFSI